MAITFNPQIKYAQKTSFRANEIQREKTQEKNFINDPEITPKNLNQDTTKSSNGLLANIAYVWVNLTEGTKGLIKGVFYGLLTGGIIATATSIKSGLNKFHNKQIKFLEMFNPRKTISKKNAVLATIAAATVFAGNLILARLRTNSKTANVDHMLYEGHRDK